MFCVFEVSCFGMFLYNALMCFGHQTAPTHAAILATSWAFCARLSTRRRLPSSWSLWALRSNLAKAAAKSKIRPSVRCCAIGLWQLWAMKIQAWENNYDAWSRSSQRSSSSKHRKQELGWPAGPCHPDPHLLEGGRPGANWQGIYW